MTKRIMSTVFDALKVFLIVDLSIKLTVLIDVFLVLDFLSIRSLADSLFMLLLKALKSSRVVLLSLLLLKSTASLYRLQVLVLVVLLKISLGLCDQLGDLSAVLGLNLLCKLQLSLVALDKRVALFGGDRLIALCRLNSAQC